jgi:hypothetical protein
MNNNKNNIENIIENNNEKTTTRTRTTFKEFQREAAGRSKHVTVM